ncbi:MAG: sulfur carrier protein ThiS [Nitrospiria bacterium]
MRLKVNGKEEETLETNLIDLLKSKDIEPRMVTVELNKQLVDRTDLSRTTLQEGDELEFIYFMGGGSEGF